MITTNCPRITLSNGRVVEVDNFGFYFGDREKLDPPLDREIEECTKWLQGHEKSSSPTENSYDLKVWVEIESGIYISNGAMIVAAFLADIPISIFRDDKNDAMLAISSAWLRKRKSQKTTKT